MTTTASTSAAAAIDPFAPLLEGTYVDDVVEVRRVAEPGDLPDSAQVRTAHFAVDRCGGRLRVHHAVQPEAIGEALTSLLVDELSPPGVVDEIDTFERVFVGVVRTSGGDATDAWIRFYRNVIQADEGAPEAELAAVRTFAAGLVPRGSVLELGSCFGFLSLRLALAGHPTTATDLDAGTMRLLGHVADALDVPLRTAVVDAADVPLPDRSVDTVLALHLLEHVDDATGERILTEALRVARRRTIIAVPLEEVADPTFGHVRCISLDDLERWGHATGCAFRVHEHHGGWLVIDAPER